MSIHTTCNEERRNEYKRINSKKKMGLSFIILRSHQDDHGESHKAGPGWIYQSSSTYNVFHFSRSCVVTPYALPAGGVHLELEMIGLGATPASDPGGGGPRLAAEREPRAVYKNQTVHNPKVSSQTSTLKSHSFWNPRDRIEQCLAFVSDSLWSSPKPAADEVANVALEFLIMHLHFWRCWESLNVFYGMQSSIT
jgi:hypothetical protein